MGELDHLLALREQWVIVDIQTFLVDNHIPCIDIWHYHQYPNCLHNIPLCSFLILVRLKGFEPSIHYWKWLLRPSCMPFHHKRISKMERDKGFEPFSLAWKAGAQPIYQSRLKLEALSGIEPPSKGFAGPCITTLLQRRESKLWSG